MAREVGLEPLQVACELVLEGHVVTAAVVLNEIRRLLAPRQPAMLTVPDMLQLQTEPLADSPIAVAMIICARLAMSSIEQRGSEPRAADRAAQLNALHLYGMATAWNEWFAEGPRRPVQPEAWLDRMIEAELADRQVRSLRYQLKVARFPVHRDLTGIDWAETPLPQAQIQQSASAALMETAHDLILVGGTGTGKTHLATALGVAAIHRGKRVRFYTDLPCACGPRGLGSGGYLHRPCHFRLDDVAAGLPILTAGHALGPD
ncbi:MAG: ATP-binding protein [Falsiroseomonas sp.]|nr:ATP-binding protein [Falsiroseomonas sp.]MDP3415466.1 ATP-binding protein [Falsiroseomonas sp.]